MSKIYLAGPITAGSYAGVTEWRDYVRQQMIGYCSKLSPGNENYIHCFSPMRHKEYLLQETNIADTYEENITSSQKGITTRDRFDATRADILFVNLLGATRVSIGTMIELGWADANRIPIVLVMEKSGNIHDHGMVREICGFRTDNLDEAISAAAKILLP
jgi:nucleoside 2-deoxyribosyltransferase